MKLSVVMIVCASGAVLSCGGSVASPAASSGDDGGGGVVVPEAGDEDAGVADASQGEAAPPADASPADAGFETAAHEPLPQIPDQGGPRLAHPKLVTITYQGFSFEQQVKAFGDFVVASHWLQSVGADYGVGAGEHVHVQLTDAVPSTVASSDTEATIAKHIADGTLPGGVQTQPTDYLYMIFYPPGVTMSDLDPSMTCAAYKDQSSAAWHTAVDSATQRFAYAVIPTCSKQAFADVEVGASHELIEAATDAFPMTHASYQFPSTSPWYATGEVGDMCEFMAAATEAGHSLSRVWSNSGAKAGTWPCVPAPPGPYFNVSASPDAVHTVAAGQSLTLTVSGWSTAPTSPWTVQAFPYPFGFTPTAQLSASTVANGTTTTLTLGVPAGTASGSQAWVLLLSGSAYDPVSLWPIALQVP